MAKTCVSSADKILQAATELFASNNFDGTSTKEIAKLSGVNSALISYYFGGKKTLYQEVLNKQATLFLDLIEQVNKQTLSPAAKLQLYIKEVSLVQLQRPMQVNLIYRELLTPSGFCNNFVQSRLYQIHKFLFDLVSEGITYGCFKSDVQPTYAAFTIESIIVFFFLTQSYVRELGPFANENEYLENALNSYLRSISK
ncbi:MAG: TetR/AcrR family transcriptional regulator [Acidaminococcaceae bacterium]